MRFHVTPAEAEQAGFRPCRRCRPNEPGLAKQRAAAVARACRLIETAETMPNLETLAAAAGLSRFHFHRVFKTITGVTPKAYAAARRTHRVRQELTRNATVTEAIYGAGFNSEWTLLCHVVGSARHDPDGLSLRGTRRIHPFRRRRVLAGLRPGGGDREGSLRDPPRRRSGRPGARTSRPLSRAQLVGGDAGFERLVARVVGFVEEPALGLDLPLDVRGTAFQQRVWQALREIPAGSTASYTKLAARIGAPTAVRAVARACATNALAVAIPCHRVVRSDGGLSGYRWGVERKRALLAREAALRVADRMRGQ